MSKSYEEIKSEVSELLDDKIEVQQFLKLKESERTALLEEISSLEIKKSDLEVEIKELENHANEHFEKREENFNRICQGEISRLEKLEEDLTSREAKLVEQETKNNSLKNELEGKIVEFDDLQAEYNKKMIDLDTATKKLKTAQELFDQDSIQLTENKQKLKKDQDEVNQRLDKIASDETKLVKGNNELIANMQKCDEQIADINEKTKLLKEATIKYENAVLKLKEEDEAVKKQKEQNEIDKKNNKNKAANLAALEEQLAIKAAELEKKGNKR